MAYTIFEINGRGKTAVSHDYSSFTAAKSYILAVNSGAKFVAFDIDSDPRYDAADCLLDNGAQYAIEQE